jgi:site-specific DNA-methyltransferase (adenine-specific)
MLINNDCLLALDELEENSVDAIVTDPPYELNFMGKGWDNAGISFSKDTWAKCLRVLKPGGYMLAFGGSRTYHRIACAIEDAGFEIRDCIMWLYGSGFPKSMNIGLAIDKKNGVESEIVGTRKQSGAKFKLTQELIDNGGFNSADRTSFELKQAKNEWAGWGTALKPSYEPIVVARKPLDGSCVANVMKWGVGGLNIDECRVGDEVVSIHNAPTGSFAGGEYGRGSDTESYRSSTGRFPANTILDTQDGEEWRRYFYCAKASKNDRDEGLEEFSAKTSGQMTERKEGSAGITAFTGSRSPKKNNHPTVKPTELMRYLVRLVTPKGGTVLDPFMGSGSTGKAVACENNERNAEYKFIGIEKETEYCKIAEARIKYVEQSERQQKLI